MIDRASTFCFLLSFPWHFNRPLDSNCGRNVAAYSARKKCLASSLRARGALGDRREPAPGRADGRRARRAYREWIRLTEEKVQTAQVAPNESKRADGRGHRPQGGINAAVRELRIDRTEAQRAVGALPACTRGMASAWYRRWDKTGSCLATAPLPWGGVERFVKHLPEKKMNMSDNVIAQPVELADAELDAVSAGLAEPTRSPLQILRTDVVDLVETILSDLGGSKPRA
jgi:hypothetical protein